MFSKNYEKVRILVSVIFISSMVFSPILPVGIAFASEAVTENIYCPNGGDLTYEKFVEAKNAGLISFSIVTDASTNLATVNFSNQTGCTAPMSLSVYKMFVNSGESNWLSTQQLFDSTGIINAPASTIYEVNLPSCMAQIDFWYGLAPTILLDSNPYGGPTPPVVVDWKFANDNLCSNIPTNTPPTITLIGGNPIEVTVNTIFTDPGATANDTEDGNLTDEINVTGSVATSTVGTYTLTYSVTDSGGLSTSTTRQVIVKEATNQCAIDIVSDISNQVVGGSSAVATYNQNPRWTASIPGATWIWKTFFVPSPSQDETQTFTKTFNVTSISTLDSASLVVAADNSYTVSVNGTQIGVDTAEFNYFDENKDTYNIAPNLISGSNTISFTVKNWGIVSSTAQDNPAGLLYKLAIRTHDANCNVVPTNTPPTITLIGANPFNLTVNTIFTDPGATANDTEDGNLTDEINVTGSVATSTVGTYTLTYSVTDSGGLSTSTTRTVNVNPVVCTENCGGGSTPNADLAVTKIADKNTPNVGDTLVYNIKVVNNGPDNATGVIVTDVLPSELNFVSAISTVGSYSTTTGVWTIGNLTNNASTTLSITVTVKNGMEGKKITNTAVASSIQADSNSANNTVNVDVTVYTPAIPPVNPPVNPPSGGGGGGGIGGHRHPIVAGEILGATSCSYLRDHLKIDWNNDPIEVLKLQSFLNVFEKENLSYTGVFNQATFEAVQRFQIKYNDDILIPWGDKVTTGFVYILTKKKVNEIYCNSPFPVTQIEQNEIDAFNSSSFGFGGDSSGAVSGTDTSNQGGSNIGSGSDTSSDISGINVLDDSPVVELKDGTTTPSVLRNAAISLFALPQKIFGSWKYFLAFIILIIILITIIKSLFGSNDDSDNGSTTFVEGEMHNKKISTNEDSPVIILPGVNKDEKETFEILPNEEIIVENPEEDLEETILENEEKKTS